MGGGCTDSDGRPSRASPWSGWPTEPTPEAPCGAGDLRAVAEHLRAKEARRSSSTYALRPSPGTAAGRPVRPAASGAVRARERVRRLVTR